MIIKTDGIKTRLLVGNGEDLCVTERVKSIDIKYKPGELPRVVIEIEVDESQIKVGIDND